jgi:hypothetical protein
MLSRDTNQDVKVHGAKVQNGFSQGHLHLFSNSCTKMKSFEASGHHTHHIPKFLSKIAIKILKEVITL